MVIVSTPWFALIYVNTSILVIALDEDIVSLKTGRRMCEDE
jgi:hypothetical protein